MTSSEAVIFNGQKVLFLIHHSQRKRVQCASFPKKLCEKLSCFLEDLS